MANELDVGSIVLQIRANAEGLKEGMGQLEAALGQAQAQTQQAGAGIDKSAKDMAGSVNASAMAQSAAYGTIAAAAAKAFAVVVGAINTSIEAMNRYQSAIIGLDSIASGKGIGSQAMTQALDKVTDSFFDAAAASTAFKNLLARGYDLDQATSAIERLKDSAAFGRQASLGLAEAVVSATEGLKNENSILVDNAGVTRNVAKMWEDYAGQLGITTAALTQQQKIEAEVKGIMQETQHQVGDLAKLQDTLAGAQAKTAQSGQLLSQAFGSALAPVVEVVTTAFGGFMEALTGIVNEFPALTAGVTAAALAIGAFVAVQKAAAALKALSATIQVLTANTTVFGIALSTALPWLAAIGAVIGIATAAYTHFSKKAEEAAKAAEEQARAEKEKQQALQATADDLAAVGKRYEELSGKTNRTYAESQEMLAIEARLKEQYDITGGSLLGLAGNYDTVTEAIRQKRIETLKEMQEAKTAAVEAARVERDNILERNKAAVEYQKLLQEKIELEKTSKNLSDYESDDAMRLSTINGLLTGMKIKYGEVVASLTSEQAADDVARAGGNIARAWIDEVTNQFEIDGGEVDQSVKGMLDRLFIDLSKNPDFKLGADALADIYTDALANVDAGPAVQAMEDINRQMVMGLAPKEGDQQKIAQAWQAILAFAQQVGGDLGLDDAGILDFAVKLAPVMGGVSGDLTDATAASQRFIDTWKDGQLAGFLKQEGQELAETIKKTNDGLQTELKAMTSLSQQFKDGKTTVAALEALITGLESNNTALVDSAKRTLKELGLAVPETVAAAQKALQQYSDIQENTKEEQRAQYDLLIQLRQDYLEKMAALQAEGRGDSAAYTSLKAYVAMIDLAMDAASRAGREGGVLLVTPGQVEQLDAATASLKELKEAQQNYGQEADGTAKKIQQQNEQLRNLQTLRAGKESGQTQTEGYQAALDFLTKFPEYAGLADASLEAVDGKIVRLQESSAAAAMELAVQLTVLQTLLDGINTRISAGAEGDELTALTGLKADIESIIEGAENLANMDLFGGMSGGFDIMTASAEELQAKLDGMTDSLVKQKAALENQKSALAYRQEIQKIADAQIAGKASAEDWAKAQENYTKIMGTAAGSAEEMSNVMALSIDNITGEISRLGSEGDAMANAVMGFVNVVNSARPELNLNSGPAIAAMNAFISVWNTIAAFLGLPTIGGGSGSRGGGGGGGKSRYGKDLDAIAHDVAMGRLSLEQELARLEAIEQKYRDRRGRSTLKAADQLDLEERLYKLREEIRKQRLDNSLEDLDDRKALDQLTIAQEVEALQEILRSHELNARERKDLEIRLHDALKRLREEGYSWELALMEHQVAMGRMTVDQQIAEILRLQAAHELSVEQQRTLEERLHSLRLQQAQEQEGRVQTVYDQITAALRKRYEAEKKLETEALDSRIQHLKDLNKAENQQAQRQTYEDNLAGKQRELAVTKSARRRRELQAEIDKLIADEERRQRQEERQEEMDALAEEKKAVAARYEQLIAEENLRQEALRLVMSGNLQQMTSLIASYGSQWKNAGEQLAQALTQGIIGSSSTIVQQINQLLAQQQAAVNNYLAGMGNVPTPAPATRGVSIQLNGLTVREEADIDRVADRLYEKIKAAGR